jgi:hypothetical protein
MERDAKLFKDLQQDGSSGLVLKDSSDVKQLGLPLEE